MISAIQDRLSLSFTDAITYVAISLIIVATISCSRSDNVVHSTYIKPNETDIVSTLEVAPTQNNSTSNVEADAIVVASPSPAEEQATAVASATPVEEGEFVIEASYATYYGENSLDEIISYSDLIAIVRFSSAHPVAVPFIDYQWQADGRYKAEIQFNFEVVEYLKGTGANNVTVNVGYYKDYSGLGIVDSEPVDDGRHHGSVRTFESYDDAVMDAQLAIGDRESQFDDRDAVIFLENPLTVPEEYASGLATLPQHYQFATRGPVWLNEYTIALLPASDDANVQGTSDGNRQFMVRGAPLLLGLDGKNIGPIASGTSSISDTTISLNELKSRIVEIDGWMAQGGQGYKECVQEALFYNRQFAWDSIHRPNRSTLINKVFDFDLASGKAAGLEVESGWFFGGYPDMGYDNRWLSGPDIEYFVLDVVDDDDQASTGYGAMVSTSRPLPEGDYRIVFNTQLDTWAACGYYPTYDIGNTWQIKVSAPRDVIHEAFFDPGATDSGEAGYEVSEFGTLPQDTFDLSHSDVNIRVERLTWYEDAIEMEFEPHIDFSPFEMDIIELDGSRSLTLPFGSATVRGHDDNQSYSWGHCDQPWHEGDKLMIRIREAGASGDVGPSVFPKPCEGSSPSRRSGEPTDDGPTGQDGASTPEDDETASEQSPDAPRIVDIEEEGTSALIVWEEPETGGNNIVGYRIFRAGPADMELSIIVEDTASTETDYSDEMLDYETEYRYAVAAVYTDGTVSPMSAIASTITNRFVAEE